MKITDQLSKLVRHVQVNRKDGKSNRNRLRRLLFEQMEERRLLTTIDLAALTAAQGTTIFGAGTFDISGHSVSSAGDVNGDGFDDLLIGAQGADASGNAKSYAGDSYVIFGGASPQTIIDLANLGSAGITIFGAGVQDRSGYSVSSAGDVNGDGFDDLLIGAPFADASSNAKPSSGESYVIFGGASLPATIDLANLSTAGITIFGADWSDYSGRSVSSAGDVNGDGFDDLLIGAPFADASGNAKLTAGDSYVIFGGASLPATIDLANLSTAGITIFGAGAGDYSGGSVSSAGDVNGDGFDDLLIGAFFADASGNAKQDAGESYVIFGGASLPETIDLANLGTAGVTIFGAGVSDRSGLSASSAGDVNGDGFDDLLIGAEGGDASGNAKVSAGESYLIFGGASLPTTIDLATLGTAGITIFGADAGDQSGRSVSSAGDVNGDGFDDLLIGAPYADAMGNSKSVAGDSYVIFGGASLPTTIDLATLGTAGITIFGADVADQSGRSLNGVGDVNGDGFDDLIIGARNADGTGNAKSFAGDSYVIFGGNFTAAITHGGTAAGETLTGTSAANVMNGARGNDILIGNGGADVLIGGQGNDILAVSDLSFKRIVGGTGSDTLRLDGSGLNLDMTAIRDNRILGIEQIDLTGTGNNTLTLNYREVLNISDESNTLIVRRNAGDVVNIGSGWTQTSNETIGADLFNVYIQGTAKLKVQSTPSNSPPTANAGGPYQVLEGQLVGLDTSGTTDPDQESSSLNYLWDFDQDGVFDDAIGRMASFDAANIDGPTALTISLKVTDNGGLTAFSTAIVNVQNRIPIINSVTSTTASPGSPLLVTIDATDVDSLLYDFDFDANGVFEQTTASNTASHVYTTSGSYTVNVRVRDDDGGQSSYTTIVSVRPKVSFATSGIVVAEEVGTATFELSLDQPSAQDVSVFVDLSGTADYNDYSLPNRLLVIPAGATTATYQISILNDTRSEDEEFVGLTIASATNAVFGSIVYTTIRITDSDPIPVVKLTGTGVISEDNTVGRQVGITSSVRAGRPIVVPFSVRGSAILGVDYTLSSDRFVIQENFAVSTIKINLINDTIAENDESIIIDLGTPSYATLPAEKSNKQFTLTIADNDLPIVGFVGHSQALDESVGTFSLRARIRAPLPVDLVVPLLVDPSSKMSANIDYLLLTNSIVIPAGQIEGATTITIRPDTLEEGLEDLVLHLGAMENAGRDSFLRTFRLYVNDDDTVQASFVKATTEVYEDVGSVPIAVKLSNPSTSSRSYDVYKSELDGTSSLFTRLTIPAGTTNVNFSYSVTNNLATDGDKTVQFTFSGNPRDKSPQIHALTIRDDDPLVSFDRKDQTIEEGDLGKVTISLSKPTNKPVTVGLKAVRVRGASTADYSFPNSVTIPAFSQSTTFDVQAIDDTLVEATESFRIDLKTVSSGLLGKINKHTISIHDYDQPTVLLKTTSKTLDEKEQDIGVEISLTTTSTQDIVVPIFIGGTARFESDYQMIGRATHPESVTIPAGSLSASVGFRIVDDTERESDEVITLKIFKPINATKSDSDNYKLTIRSNDAPTGISSTDAKSGATASGGDKEPPPPPPEPKEPTPSSGTLAISIFADSESVGSISPDELGSSIPPGTVVLINAPEQSVSTGGGGTLAISFGSSAGYISGGIVFFDANFNQRLDYLDIDNDGEQDFDEPTEPSGLTTTDGRANFEIPDVFDLNGDQFISPNEGQFVSYGGIDISTGMPQELVFVSPVGAFIAESLTTLVAGLNRDYGFTLDDAMVRVCEALGLTVVDFSRLDLLHSTAEGYPISGALFGADTQLYDTVYQIAKLISGDPNSPDFSVVGSYVFSDLTQRVATDGSILLLSSKNGISSSIETTAYRLGIDIPENVRDTAADIISQSNAAIQEVQFLNGKIYLGDVVRAQRVAQQSGMLLHGVLSGAGNIDLIHAQYTGENLANAILSTAPLDVLAPALLVTDVVQTEGNSGTQEYTFKVVLHNGSTNAISVDYTTIDDSSDSATGDYVTASGSLSWLPGDITERTIVVQVRGDSTFEADEKFGLLLSNAVNAVIRKDVGWGVVKNNDAFEYTVATNGPADSVEILLNENGLQVSDAGQLVLSEFNSASIMVHGSANRQTDFLISVFSERDSNNNIRIIGSDLGTDTLRILDTGFDLIEFQRFSPTSGRYVLDGVQIEYSGIANNFPDLLASDVAASTDEDSSKTITLVASGSSSDPLTFEVVSSPSHGVLSGTAPNLIYTPFQDYFGSDSFTYIANDGVLNSNVATVTLTVVSINDAPQVANPIADRVLAEGAASFDIDLANVFADVDDLVFTFATSSSNSGLVNATVVNGIATITLTGAKHGIATLSVTATDSGNLSVSDEFNITVLNSLPTLAVSDALDGYSGTTGQDRVLRLTANDTTDNGTRPFTYEVLWGDGSPLETFSGPSVADASHTYATTGSKNVQVRTIDPDGGASEWVTKTLTIARTEVQGNVLAIGGNTGDDVLTFTPGASSPVSQVLLNAVSLGAINVPTGGIKFFGGSGNDTLIMNGTAGNDIVTTDVTSIVWNGSTTWPQAVRLDSEGIEKLRVQTQAGNDEIVITGGNAEVDGGTGTDRMTGPNSGGLWNVTGYGIGTLNGLSFLGIESVLGGSGDDAYVFGSAGAFTGIVDGDGGQDTLNLSAKTTAITISLLANTATSTGGIRNIEQFVGGIATTDTFTAPNTANAWQLTGPISGSLNSTVGFLGFETLKGGTATDSFAVEPAASSFAKVDGGSGTDSLIYSGFSSGIQVDLANRTAPGVASFIGIESLIGSSASDLLIGPNSANAWTINGPNSGALGTTLFQSFESIRGGTGNDTVTLTATGGLTGSVDGATGTDTLIGPSLTEVNVDWTITSTGSGVVNTVSFLGMENLTGGTSVDRFFMYDGGSVIGTINGGSNPTGQRDHLNYAAVTSPVAIDLATNGYTNVGLISGIEEVVGTAGSSDLIRGGNVANTWSLTGIDTGTVGSLRFVDIENLTGGILADSFSLVAGGSVRGTMRGGLGVDTLVGANANNVWRVQGENTGLINSLAYQEIESLTGGSATDTFEISPSASIGGVLNAGSGIADRLDFSNWSSMMVLNLQTRGLPGGGTFTGVEQVVGSLSSGDLLIGPNATTSWSISGVDLGTSGAIQFSGFESVQGGSANDTFTLGVAGALTGVVRGGDGVDTLVGPSPGLGSITDWHITSSGGGSIRDVDFEGIENLTGGSHLDRFLFSATGEVTGTINGGASGTGERDQVSYAAVAGPITIDLQAKTQPRVTLLVGIEELVGTVASDELRGLNAANTWNLTAANTGTVGTFRFVGFENLRGGTLADTFSFVAGGTVANLDGGSGIDTILGPNVVTHWDLQSPGQGTIGTSVFVSIENLTGGTAVDTFNISPSGTLAGALNGGTTGRNVLSYAAWSNSVTVNLATKVASGIAGAVTNFTIVQGGSGDDQLSGNSTLGTILLGMHGNDSLVGVSGRDIMIGGFGGDIMTGGAGDDLLIAGATVYDNDVGSLSRIFDEWSTTTRNYQTRVNNLRGIGTGPRLNGELFLQNAPSYTLYADPGSVDQLIGGLGQDWFITDDLADSVDQVMSGLLAELRDNVSNLS